MDIRDAMCDIIRVVRHPTSSAEQRDDKATQVQRHAELLLSRWTAIQGRNQGTTWYMHAAYHHLPGMIRSLPCDVIQASGDSMERSNQHFKTFLRSWAIENIPSFEILIFNTGKVAKQRSLTPDGKARQCFMKQWNNPCLFAMFQASAPISRLMTANVPPTDTWRRNESPNKEARSPSKKQILVASVRLHRSNSPTQYGTNETNTIDWYFGSDLKHSIAIKGARNPQPSQLRRNF